MKTTINILILIIFFGNTISAQGEKHFQKRNEFLKKQIEYIVSQLQLTEKEKKEFIPLLKELNAKKEKLFIEKRNKMHYFYKNSLNMSDKELTDLADFLAQNNLQQAKLGKEYNEKFKTVLPPIKIVLLYKAEQQFKKMLFKKMKHKGQGMKQNK